MNKKSSKFIIIKFIMIFLKWFSGWFPLPSALGKAAWLDRAWLPFWPLIAFPGTFPNKISSCRRCKPDTCTHRLSRETSPLESRLLHRPEGSLFPSPQVEGLPPWTFLPRAAWSGRFSFQSIWREASHLPYVLVFDSKQVQSRSGPIKAFQFNQSKRYLFHLIYSQACRVNPP